MVSKEDIEGFLDRISAEGASYREVEPGLWIVKPGGELDFAIVVNYTPPVVLMRVKVMSLPTNENDLATLSRRLSPRICASSGRIGRHTEANRPWDSSIDCRRCCGRTSMI